ncbi:class F sortase [Streptomyces sp. NPDC086783]|uniref:class F sortase n=1 Tax=Streptomyces sp. NPDC086783 TaxID=3365758 RepID=UPI00380B0E2C
MTSPAERAVTPAVPARSAPAVQAPSRRLVTAVVLGTLLSGCGGGTDDARSATAPPGDGRESPESDTKAKTPQRHGSSAPVRLRIPAISVDTPLIRLGLAKDGSVQVPPVTAHDRAGWYEHSPAPGQVGPSVILGHVTVGAYGDGVFRRLDRLRPGDTVTAGLGDGTAASFSVTSVRTVAKNRFPAKAVYGDVNRPELRLITCGGPRTDEGYRDNVIVFARLKSVTP